MGDWLGILLSARSRALLTRKGALLFLLANGANLTSTLSVPWGVYGGGLGRGPKLQSAHAYAQYENIYSRRTSNLDSLGFDVG